ncbi:MAG: hypothetical protein JST04_06145 [Bdellovibrionales bacterium]|nr:hypothetical protein [Bdellovibrionales bacterium]
MSRSLFSIVILLAVVSGGVTTLFALADVSDPGAQSSVLPSPAESGMPEKISRKEVRRIRREFTELLDSERDALRAVQSKRRKEGDADRKARRKEFDARERAARRKFFEENAHGPERRTYVKDLTARREAFIDGLKSEEKQERAELDARWKALKDSQRTRLNAVEEYLRRSERPLSTLLERAD